GALRDCGEAGVKVVVVGASGFGEAGSDGVRLQDEIAELANSYGMRLIGPNAQGVIATAARLDLCFSYATIPFENEWPSGVAYVGQSGAIGAAVMERARERGH